MNVCCKINENVLVEIPMSKIELIKTILGSLLFVSISVWFAFAFGQEQRLVAMIVVACGGFFALCGLWATWRLCGSSQGLIITDTGFYEYASAVVQGFVAWEEVEEIICLKYQRQLLINVFLKNLEEFISQKKSTICRFLQKQNYRFIGTPVSFSSGDFQQNSEEVERILLGQFESFQKRTQ